jgi:hypothetical protein
MKVKAATYKFQDTFINGDTAVDANSFDGLKKRLTGAQVIDAATNGLPVIGADDADIHAFFDQLDALLAAVPGGADALYMNAMILGEDPGGGPPRGRLDEQTRDDFGRTIDTYNGVPLLDIGTKADGTLIIPQTETQGTSNGRRSIYAVRFGEDEADQAVTGLTNGGVQVDDLGELETKPALRTRIEFYCGVAVFGRGGPAGGRAGGRRGRGRGGRGGDASPRPHRPGESPRRRDRRGDRLRPGGDRPGGRDHPQAWLPPSPRVAPGTQPGPRREVPR